MANHWTDPAARQISGVIGDALRALAAGVQKAYEAACATATDLMDDPESRER